MNEIIRSAWNIETINLKKDVEKTAKLYADVFAPEPWNEYTRCQKTGQFYGLETEFGQPCTCCQDPTPLELAYPVQATQDYIRKESSKPNSQIFVAKEGNAITAFTWGYSYTPEKFATEKYRNEVLQQNILTTLERSEVNTKFFYLSECGVSPKSRYQGLASQMISSLLSSASKLGLIALGRTNYQSPMASILVKQGMTQISGPEVVPYDPKTGNFGTTGSMIGNLTDTENPDRVLFIT